MQIKFGDINVKFDDLTTIFKALRFRTNMNREIREAHVEDEAHNQPVIEPIHANLCSQYDYEYSFNEDLFWLMGGINRNRKKNWTCLKTYLRINLTLDLFLKFHLDNHLSTLRVLMKMNLMGSIRPCQIKPNNHNPRDKNQSTWLNFSMSKNLSLTRMFYMNLMEMMKKIYMMTEIFQTRTWRTR